MAAIPSVDPYLDPKRFPLTTQPGLDLRQQKMIDAINRDDIRRKIEAGETLPPDLQAIWKEFEEKAKLAQPVGGGGAPAAPAAS